MKCPVCRATYYPRTAPFCRRCGADLSSLIQVHDRAIWHYRYAIQQLNDGNYAIAQTHIEQALALHHANADFHALAGQLWALQGEFQQTIVAWKQAQALDPNHAVGRYLQIMMGLFGE